MENHHFFSKSTISMGHFQYLCDKLLEGNSSFRLVTSPWQLPESISGCLLNPHVGYYMLLQGAYLLIKSYLFACQTLFLPLKSPCSFLTPTCHLLEPPSCFMLESCCLTWKVRVMAWPASAVTPSSTTRSAESTSSDDHRWSTGKNVFFTCFSTILNRFPVHFPIHFWEDDVYVTKMVV